MVLLSGGLDPAGGAGSALQTTAEYLIQTSQSDLIFSCSFLKVYYSSVFFVVSEDVKQRRSVLKVFHRFVVLDFYKR